MGRIARRICRGGCETNARSFACAAKTLLMARADAPLREAVGQRDRTQIVAVTQPPRRFRLSKCMMEYSRSILRRVSPQGVDLEVAEMVGLRVADAFAVDRQLDQSALDVFFASVRAGMKYIAADEALVCAPQVAVEDSRLGVEFRPKNLQALACREDSHALIRSMHGFQRAGRTGLNAPRFRPTLVEQMRIEDPGLRNLLFLVPGNLAVRTGGNQLLAAPRFHRSDDDDAVGSLVDGAVPGGF